MSHLPLRFLLARLLSPIPRVRWETGRSLAKLIRERDVNCVTGLLDWIAARRLESEVVLGLGIIDAFDLGDYFEFEDVLNAVQSHSHLSDWLLRRNFTTASRLSPLRYRVSPVEAAVLPHEQEHWFDRYREWAVPPLFTYRLMRLQQATGFPFRMRWRHEWRWLQAIHARPPADYPRFVSGYDQQRRGQFDQGQRELYVSAFLRTLAYFAMCGHLSHTEAEQCAVLALTMNRGLAEVEPVERPTWAAGLFERTGADVQVATDLWTAADAMVNEGETPIAVRVVEANRERFVESDIVLVVGEAEVPFDSPTAEELPTLTTIDNPGDMSGTVGSADEDVRLKSQPFRSTQTILPDPIGRAHVGMALDVRLASPVVFGRDAKVRCTVSDIRLEENGGVLSRWIHWYSDWEPAGLVQVPSGVGSIATIRQSRLDQLKLNSALKTARLVSVRRGRRRDTHREFAVESGGYWA